MIFRKKRCFWPGSTGFCISEHKKSVYVQTACRSGAVGINRLPLSASFYSYFKISFFSLRMIFFSSLEI